MNNNIIKDPNYKCREEFKEKIDMVSRAHGRFKDTGWAMPKDQFKMYHALRNTFMETVKAHPQYPKFIWKPKVCDMGCGLGIGSNILSQEADFVWGIDNNEENIRWATQMYERQKNNIYWSPQLTFDVVDIYKDPREFMTFDVITAIEIIEHLAEPEALMTFIKRLCKKDKHGNFPEPPQSTIVWISTPNRNSDKIQKDTPRNEHHVFEANVGEMYEFLTKYFKYVVLYDYELNSQIDLNAKNTPVIFKCETPII